jgi:hypothetical protein
LASVLIAAAAMTGLRGSGRSRPPRPRRCLPPLLPSLPRLSCLSLLSSRRSRAFCQPCTPPLPGVHPAATCQGRRSTVRTRGWRSSPPGQAWRCACWPRWRGNRQRRGLGTTRRTSSRLCSAHGDGGRRQSGGRMKEAAQQQKQQRQQSLLPLPLHDDRQRKQRGCSWCMSDIGMMHTVAVSCWRLLLRRLRSALRLLTALSLVSR